MLVYRWFTGSLGSIIQPQTSNHPTPTSQGTGHDDPSSWHRCFTRWHHVASRQGPNTTSLLTAGSWLINEANNCTFQRLGWYIDVEIKLNKCIITIYNYMHVQKPFLNEWRRFVLRMFQTPWDLFNIPTYVVGGVFLAEHMVRVKTTIITHRAIGSICGYLWYI